jgi:hypothetical protein
MAETFVPLNFIVPEVLETDKFRIRVLRAADVDLDYDAVITSVDHLKGVFGEQSNWPSVDLTSEQDRKDLEWHENEFDKRSSFTYTVVDLDESLCLGCVYIFPSRSSDCEADIYLWVRKSAYDEGLDPVLFHTVTTWIKDKWPFTKVRYPGRE